MDLFEFANGRDNQRPNQQHAGTDRRRPLAYRMRPRSFDEFVGHQKVLGPKGVLRQWIESDRVPSIILWGPPGCGKTTIAELIAGQTHSDFQSVSAVLSGIKEIKEAVARASELLKMRSVRTILFVDEIHRFNKAQQDALLPHVEAGTVTLIGATTENPSFEVIPALLSRTRVVRLERLRSEDLEVALERALRDPERGLGGFLRLSKEVVTWLSETSEGDARRALTSLEALALHARGGEGGATSDAEVTLEEAQRMLEAAGTHRPVLYDKGGEEHYNVISAFIKSIRGSDAHAALYYLARMLEGGEDPLFIARRMVILASEDVGNADPRALMVAISVKEAVEFIGLPEARISLAQGVTYLASAPKSNASYVGIDAALAEVRKSGALPVPHHLRNAVTALMKNEGYGSGYQYAHDYPGARVTQNDLPELLAGRTFYHPKDSGLERQIRERMNLTQGEKKGVDSATS